MRLSRVSPIAALIAIAMTSVILLASFEDAKSQGRKVAAHRAAQARFAAALRAYDRVTALFDRGECPGEEVYLWSRRVEDARRDLGASKADHISAAQGHLKRMEELRSKSAARLTRSRNDLPYLASDVYAKEAEFLLARARQE